MRRPRAAAVAVGPVPVAMLLVVAALLAAASSLSAATAARADSTLSAPDLAAAARADTLRRAREEAGIDSLNAYWRHLDDGWYEPLAPDMLRTDLDAAALDSLTHAGDRELGALLAGRRWRLVLQPLVGTAFNRCEGWRPCARARLRRLGPDAPEIAVTAGYAISRRRVAWDAAAAWPLARALPAARPDAPPERPWTRLAGELSAGDGVAPMAAAASISQAVSAGFSGDDPVMYYARRAGAATLAWRPARRLELRAGFLVERHRPLAVLNNRSAFGGRSVARPNWPATALATRAAVAGIAWTGGRYELRGEAQWHHVTGEAPPGAAPPGAAAARRSLLRLSAVAQGTWLDRRGNELAARVAWGRADRAAPLQWKTWMGGSQSLRGYPVRELAGDAGVLASLDARAGFDLLRALRVPLLGRLRLQPIIFADFGRTTAAGPDAASPAAVADLEGWTSITGWRADAGFGVGRLIGANGLGNLRVYFARPILNGQGARPWQLQVEVEM